MSPEEWIATAPTGTVLKGFSEEQGRIYIDFLIRESSDWLQIYPEQPDVELRAGALVELGALVVVVAWEIIPDGPIYETFWNFHPSPQQQGLQGIFEHMAVEDTLHLNYIGDSGNVEYVLQAPNTLKSFFRDITQQAASMRPWTWQTFEEAKKILSEAHASPTDLWEQLGTQE